MEEVHVEKVHVEEEAHVREVMENTMKAVQEDLEDLEGVHVSEHREEGARESEGRGETSNLEAADAQS